MGEQRQSLPKLNDVAYVLARAMLKGSRTSIKPSCYLSPHQLSQYGLAHGSGIGLGIKIINPPFAVHSCYPMEGHSGKLPILSLATNWASNIKQVCSYTTFTAAMPPQSFKQKQHKTSQKFLKFLQTCQPW